MRRIRTKAQLEADLERYQEDATVLHAALNDVLNGKVRWFKSGKIRLGVSRASGPAGGILLHKHEDYTCAYYWEKWYPCVRDAYACTRDPEGLTLRLLAFQANDWVLANQAEVK